MNWSLFSSRLLLSILFLARSFTGLAYANEKCTPRLISEIFSGKEFHYFDLTHLKSTHGYHHVKDVMGADSGVILGISSDGAHAYLLGDGVRYDGQTLFNFARIKKSSRVDPGFLIHFNQLKPETVQRLKSHLENHASLWSTQCYSGACTQLKAAGIKLKGRSPIYAPEAFTKILKKGFVDSKGNPVPYQMYRIGNHTLKDMYVELQWRRAAAQFFPALTVFLGADVAYLHFSQPQKNEVEIPPMLEPKTTPPPASFQKAWSNDKY